MNHLDAVTVDIGLILVSLALTVVYSNKNSKIAVFKFVVMPYAKRLPKGSQFFRCVTPPLCILYVLFSDEIVVISGYGTDPLDRKKELQNGIALPTPVREMFETAITEDSSQKCKH